MGQNGSYRIQVIIRLFYQSDRSKRQIRRDLSCLVRCLCFLKHQLNKASVYPQMVTDAAQKLLQIFFFPKILGKRLIQLPWHLVRFKLFLFSLLKLPHALFQKFRRYFLKSTARYRHPMEQKTVDQKIDQTDHTQQFKKIMDLKPA